MKADRHLRAPICLAAGLLAVALAGCGRGDSPEGLSDALPGGAAMPGAGQEFDGCQLIQRWDAHEVLKGSVRPAQKPVDHPAAATCVWEVHDEENPRSLQLSIFRGHELYAKDTLQDHETFEPVEDIGEDAFFVEPSGVQLHFRTTEHSVLISVDGFDGEEPLDREEVKAQLIRLAQRVAAVL